MIDAVVQPADLRSELIGRFAAYAAPRSWPANPDAPNLREVTRPVP